MELVQGMRNKQELKAFRSAVCHWGARIIHVDAEISARAMFYVEQHFHASAVRVADVLIGATAAKNGIPLLTGNAKHYRPLAQVDVTVFRK